MNASSDGENSASSYTPPAPSARTVSVDTPGRISLRPCTNSNSVASNGLRANIRTAWTSGIATTARGLIWAMHASTFFSPIPGSTTVAIAPSLSRPSRSA